ncbi:MAG: deaminase domain-containing protein [Kiritimatiellia bacterium]
MTKRSWLVAAMMGLACAFSAWAQEETSAPAPGRVPELRQIDPAKDGAALRRIDDVRAKLPAEFRKRNNFAWAVAKIDGLEKVEYFAHSGIQNLTNLSTAAAQKIPDISIKPDGETAKFTTLCVNQNGAVGGANCWQRDVDTEYKILEDIASRLPDTAVSGRVRLFTELYPCPSCWNVMLQFLAAYPNVQMQVLYRTP